ncbi:MAG: hypothetical protein LBI70_02040 [Rickettsiales bacterium]|jgi:predicted amidohydrolase|nr:hypothetical protein [Rickettsiales bacterium]
MKLGMARFYARNARPDYNFHRIEELYREALANNLEIIIFPRLALSGFSVDDDFLDNGYREELMKYLEKIIALTEAGGTKILMGSPLEEIIRENDESSGMVLRDAALFIDSGSIDTEIFRKEIDRTNIFGDYRYFEKNRFLKYFTHRGKKFLVLLSDDIYTNFNLFLVREIKPNYVLCLDSNGPRSKEIRQRQLIKLAKFANSPVFYLNSASYSRGLLFRGEVTLINEDFQIVFEDLYGGDRILPFHVDCEDGTELFLEKPDRNMNPFFIMEKYFNSTRVTLDVGRFSDAELEQMGKNDCEMVTFERGREQNTRFLKIADYISPELFARMLPGEQRAIRDTIVDLYHDRNIK